jgi:DNA-binding NtrC family response regulator
MVGGEFPLLVIGDAGGPLLAALAQLKLPMVSNPSETHALSFAQEHLVSLFLYAGSVEGALRFLKEADQLHPDIPVLVIADASDEAALSALRAGAADVLLPPVGADELQQSISKELARRPALLPPPPSVGSTTIFGSSAPMREVERLCRKVAPSSATVLIRGETGTGKEMVARFLHEQSPRSGGPFVRVHCASLPESLIESELFGYERGAFTGALKRKPGRIELAHRGTLFLDEIGDVPLHVQIKLLRVLQEREFERVGGTETIRVDVRLLAATHRHLEAMIKQGQFREDLFYRLNVIPVWLPPLRARREDLPPLARHFCAQFGAHHGKPELSFSDEALAELRKGRWPGNVRQLQNVVERLVVLAQTNQISARDIRDDAARSEAFETQAPTLTGAHETTGSAQPLDDATLLAERKVIEAALARASGNRTLAARLLGISRRTLYNKIQLFGLKVP